VQGVGFRVQGSGFEVQGTGCRVWGLGFGVHRGVLREVTSESKVCDVARQRHIVPAKRLVVMSDRLGG